MIAIGIVLNLAGLGIFCWLLFPLAVYAVPFFVAVVAGCKQRLRKRAQIIKCTTAAGLSEGPLLTQSGHSY